MALFGTVPTFNHHQNDWTIFLSQLENFFIANDIDETKLEKKKAILITSLSEDSLKLVKNLLQPVNDITTASYDDINEALSKHFKPAQAGFAERFKFYTATKDYKETILQWGARLRSLAANCDFENHLSIALRDKFIMGLPKGPVKDALFLEDASTLTFDRAVEIAQSIECIRAQYDGDRSNRKNPRGNDGQQQQQKGQQQQQKGQNKQKNRKGNEGQQATK